MYWPIKNFYCCFSVNLWPWQHLEGCDPAWIIWWPATCLCKMCPTHDWWTQKGILKLRLGIKTDLFWQFLLASLWVFLPIVCLRGFFFFDWFGLCICCNTVIRFFQQFMIQKISGEKYLKLSDRNKKYFKSDLSYTWSHQAPQRTPSHSLLPSLFCCPR